MSTPRLRLTDPKFKYTAAASTDVRRTIEVARRAVLKAHGGKLRVVRVMREDVK